MRPFFGDESGRSPGANPGSSARHASAEEPVLAPEPQAGDGESRVPAAAEESREAAADGGLAAASTEAPDEHERQLERDLDELSAKAQKADEYLELAKRTRADFENYRKRAMREAAAAQERGVIKLVRELLPAVDNLDRALEAVSANGDAGDELVSGIKLVHAEVIAALNRAGVELYSPTGERFDPTQHEAVAQQPVQGAEPGTVVEVYQRGCRLGDSVIRPARVVVAG